MFNFESALRGMRNPLESWDKSDSYWEFNHSDMMDEMIYQIGDNDLSLALKLVKAGSDHSKFMRQIFVSIDITAPLYWWKEMDTYKVGTVANSTSTMHKIGSRLLTCHDFSVDEVDDFFKDYLDYINHLIIMWQKTKDKKIWRKIIQTLLDSFNQKRTWTANYSVLRNIYHNRKSHKLTEWHEFCKIIEGLPYSELITIK